MHQAHGILRFAGIRLVALSTALMLALAPPAAAKDGEGIAERLSETDLPADLSLEGWRLLTVPGKARADFSRQGPEGVRLQAEDAVAFLYRRLPRDMGIKRKLAWRWRVDEAGAPTDLSQAGQDDRSLAVHLVFPIDAERLPFWQRIDLAVTEILAPALAGKVLTYVWGGHQTRGAMLANPHLDMHGKLIVLRSGTESTGRWFDEEIDFATDFRDAFGYEAPQPKYLVISTDSDDTGGRCSGVIAGFAFS